MISPGTTVDFDLDGFGASPWSWVQRETAILVWDPKHEGAITSGKQMFGSVTWWMFWEHGYQPLAMLDDNSDGYLSGSELTGLAIWRDQNQNAVSEAGEVIPLEATGIQKLSTQPQVHLGKEVYSRKGVQLQDGSWLSSYDWFPERTTRKP